MFHHIYIGDSENVLKNLERASVSLIVTSPPYYVMRGEMEWKTYNDYLKKMFDIFREAYEVLIPGRYCVVNICDYKYKNKKYAIPSDFIQFMSKAIGFQYIDDIIWNKPVGSSSSGAGSRAGNFVKTGFPLYYYPNNKYEHIIIFRRGRQLRYDKIYNKTKYKIDWMKFRSFLGDVWNFNTVVDSKDHPAKFPEMLPYLVISLYSLPLEHEVILDPFLGSGTTMKVARELGRSSIGIEMDDKYLSTIKMKVGWEQSTLTNKIVDNYVLQPKTGQLNVFDSLDNKPKKLGLKRVIDSKAIEWKVINV